MNFLPSQKAGEGEPSTAHEGRFPPAAFTAVWDESSKVVCHLLTENPNHLPSALLTSRMQGTNHFTDRP